MTNCSLANTDIHQFVNFITQQTSAGFSTGECSDIHQIVPTLTTTAVYYEEKKSLQILTKTFGPKTTYP